MMPDHVVLWDATCSSRDDYLPPACRSQSSVSASRLPLCLKQRNEVLLTVFPEYKAHGPNRSLATIACIPDILLSFLDRQMCPCSISKLYVQDACVNRRDNELGLSSVQIPPCNEVQDTSPATCESVFANGEPPAA